MRDEGRSLRMVDRPGPTAGVGYRDCADCVSLCLGAGAWGRAGAAFMEHQVPAGVRPCSLE